MTTFHQKTTSTGLLVRDKDVMSPTSLWIRLIVALNFVVGEVALVNVTKSRADQMSSGSPGPSSKLKFERLDDVSCLRTLTLSWESCV